MSQETRWVVLKFGGTSVSSLSNWKTIKGIVRSRLNEGLRPMLVCSALSGVSDLLEKMLEATEHGNHKIVINEIKQKHFTLAEALGLDGAKILGSFFSKLSQLAQGASLTGEVSPRLHAQVMALGELMSTHLGAVYLDHQELPTTWFDARDALAAEEVDLISTQQKYLSATCCYDTDQNLSDRLGALPTPTIITQGFIARNEQGRTVLLGRGGSDTSATYFAAKLSAVRCEIWTDVPGVYSANPRQVPTARLLKHLDYEEAQEITSMGAKVLHPRCISPMEAADIPLHIRCTTHPKLSGTVISSQTPFDGAQVKAIVAKNNILLISMEAEGMWQQVGFLADVFACYKKLGLNIDLVSSSENNVTVTLDGISNTLTPEIIDSLLEELALHCKPRKIESCASVSLVGRNIRTIIHQLGPAFEVFEEAKIHLVSQAANDLNISFVVDENEVNKMVQRLHRILFEHHRSDALLGPTWSEVFEDEEKRLTPMPTAWWREKRDELLALAAQDSPLYVYNQGTLREAAEELQKLSPVNRIFYSIKANPYPQILELFYQMDLGFECVSPGEVNHILSLFPDIDRQRILFTPNFAPRAEYEHGLGQNVIVTLDNLYPLRAWPDLFAGREIFIRIDPGHGRGHHDFVKTAGSQSKFGVSLGQIDELVKLVKKCGTRVVGLHAHSGSGILTPGNWREVASVLASLTDRLGDVRVLDLGGGLGVVEKPGQIELDLRQVSEELAQVKEVYPQLELWLEPGRFLVAHAGVLLVHVTQTKQKGNIRYVGVNTGMNTLIRPALYGAYHEIVNLTRLYDTKRVLVNVVGPICETGDVLGHERNLPAAKESDVLLIAVVGAYGHAMSSQYNLRPPAQEKFIG